MYRVSEDKLENIVFTVLDNGEIETFFVKYNVTPKQFDELSNTEQQNLTPQFQKVSANGNPEYICIDFIQTFTVYPDCPYENGVHSNGLTCDPETTTIVTSFCNWTGGGSNNTGNPTNNNNTNNNTSNTNYGNGNTSGSNGISTTPISPSALLIFELSSVLNLTPEMSAWLDNKRNWGKGEEIKKFLEEEGGCFILDMQGNTSSPECQQAIAIAEALWNIMMDDDSLTFEEAIEQYFTNNLTDVEIAEFNWYEEISPLGIDVRLLMDCFENVNPSANATFSVKIFVEQPVPNTTETYSGSDPGHTFIEMSINDPSSTSVSQIFGYYPSGSVNPIPGPFYDITADGEIRNNGSHNYHVSASIDIDNNTFFDIVNYINLFGNNIPEYNLNDYNCTDFGINIANQAGMNLPDTYGEWKKFGIKLGGGSNPGNLGQDIRTLSVPGVTVNTTTGSNSPNGDGPCN